MCHGLVGIGTIFKVASGHYWPSSGMLWTVKWYWIQLHVIMFHSLKTMFFIVPLYMMDSLLWICNPLHIDLSSFSHGDVSREVTHYPVMLFDAFFIRDDFHIADCTAETLAIKNVCSLSGLSHHWSCMWSGVCISSWTRCCQQGDHWLWQIPGLSHLPCYWYWSRVQLGHHWTHQQKHQHDYSSHQG